MEVELVKSNERD